MKVKFNVPRSLEGVDYSKGVHEVPDKFEKHWYMLAMIANGSALIVGEEYDVKTGKKAQEVQKMPEIPPEILQPHLAQNRVKPVEESKPTETPKKEPKPKKEKAQKDPNAETKYEKAKRLKAEKKAALEKAAGTTEG